MEMITVAGLDFKVYERVFFEEACKNARELCRQWLEALDAEIMKERNRGKYRSVDQRESTIKTVMGEVRYTRHYYLMRDGSSGARYVFLLDEVLGLCGSGQMSALLTERILEECMNVSFRKAAKAVSDMTGQSISHGGAWGVVQSRGTALKEQEDRLVELNETDALQAENETKVLFEEVDGVWLSMQGADRPKKIGKRELKISTQYSGWQEAAKGRYETVRKLAYAGFDEPREFYRRRDAQLACMYDVNEIEVRVVNGDGAAWIRATDEDAIMQLDPFHRSRAIMRGLTDKAMRTDVNRLLRDKDVNGALLYIKSLLDSGVDEKESKRITALYMYLNDNKDNLLTWDERGIELPPPPEGIVYRRLGTQEHSNCDIITQRMKNRKASWSISGAGNMAKLLCLRASHGLESILSKAGITKLAETVLPVLSAAQVPRYDGVGNSGGVAHGAWPFDNTFVTEGRRAIRRLFRLRTI